MPKITKQKDGSHYLLPAFCQWPLIYRVWCNLLYCPLLFFLEAVFPNRLLSKLRWLEVKFWTLFFFSHPVSFRIRLKFVCSPCFLVSSPLLWPMFQPHQLYYSLNTLCCSTVCVFVPVFFSPLECLFFILYLVNFYFWPENQLKDYLLYEAFHPFLGLTYILLLLIQHEVEIM